MTSAASRDGLPVGRLIKLMFVLWLAGVAMRMTILAMAPVIPQVHDELHMSETQFNAWFIAFTLNSPQKEAIAVRRFRPQFLIAFNAWMTTDPLHNPHAPPPARHICLSTSCQDETQANTYDNEATAEFQAGNSAATTGDNYVRITVFLAAVLFLVGIGSSFKLPGARYALVAFGSVLLVVAVVLILQQPALPS